jgi:hypothetical protein
MAVRSVNVEKRYTHKNVSSTRRERERERERERTCALEGKYKFSNPKKNKKESKKNQN